MTKEEKQEFIEALCGYLPFGVRVQGEKHGISGKLNDLRLFHKYNFTNIVHETDALVDFFHDGEYEFITNYKPYLRPMSTMTEKEKEEMHKLLSPKGTARYDIDGIRTPMSHYGDFIPYEFMNRILRYLNRHMFDYRGFIEKGWALPSENTYGENDEEE